MLLNPRYNEQGDRIENYSTSAIAMIIKFEESRDLARQVDSIKAFQLGYFMGSYEMYIKVRFHFRNQNILGTISPVDYKFLREMEFLENDLFGKIETDEEIEKRCYDYIIEKFPFEVIEKHRNE